MAAVDVAALVGGIADNGLAVVLVGTAVLLLYVIRHAFKWLKSLIGGGVMTQAESDQYFKDLYK